MAILVTMLFHGQYAWAVVICIAQRYMMDLLLTKFLPRGDMHRAWIRKASQNGWDENYFHIDFNQHLVVKSQIESRMGIENILEHSLEHLI